MKHDRSRLFYGISLLVTSISVTTLAIAQPPGGRDGNGDRRGGGGPRFELGQIFPRPLQEELNLTPAQEKELDAIQQELKSKLDKLLTDEQRQTIENFRPRRPGGPDGNGPPPSPPNSPQGGRNPERRERPSAGQAARTKNDRTARVKLKELPMGVARVPVTFSDGHETDPRDHGRPVVLIAAALGVTSDVFRDAFSKVRPARGGAEPEPAQVRQNKQALMDALGKHGITNERLDAVSNYYRFSPGRGSIWTNKAAVANALVRDGVVIGYEIIDGGSGYTSVPTVSVPEVKGASAKVELSYGKEFESNGTVSSLTVPQEKSN